MILTENHFIKNLWAIAKKINEIFINLLNFTLLIPVYYLAIGMAHLFWRIFHSEKNQRKSDWKDSPKLSEDFEDYQKHY